MSGQDEFTVALLDAKAPVPAGLATWNGSDPAARFSIYRNNVFVSLVDALADTFSVTQALVGEEFFRAMARRYVQAEMPRSRVLADYGETFADFIAAFPPAASVPYLADVARLEMLWARAYHAADAPGLPADALANAQANQDALPDMLLGLHPSLGLLRSPHAVVSIWAAHQGSGDLETVDPALAENALIIRPEWDVEVLLLDAGAAEFIAQIQGGATLGSATELALAAEANFDLTATLGLLIRQRAIATLHFGGTTK